MLWFDASVRMSSNMTRATKQAVRNGGMMLFVPTPHSNFAVTHRGMFDFLPTNIKRQQQTTQYAGGMMLIYNTRTVFEHVLRWMYLCALEEKCMAPTYERYCHFKSNKYKYYAKCHRFDQSLMNLLLSNQFGFKTSSYVCRSKAVAHFQRHFTSKFDIKVCE